MKFVLFFLLSVCLASTAIALDCSNSEDVNTSVYGMLKTELLPINLDNPETDAILRINMKDYRFLGYHNFSGLQVPEVGGTNNAVLCRFGLKVFSGISDSYESKEHRILSEKMKTYANKYNLYLLGQLREQQLVGSDAIGIIKGSKPFKK